MGYRAGNNGQTNSANVNIGSGSGYSNTSSLNVIIGADAGYYPSSSANNVFVGYGAGFGDSGGASTGDNNTFVGYQAGFSFRGGHENTYLGYLAGDNETDGSSITLLGYNTSFTSGSALTNATAVGANASVTVSNNVILGNSANVGIGTTAANNKLEIVKGTAKQSGLRLYNLTSAYNPSTSATKFLTVDGNGDVVLLNATGATGPTGPTGPTGISSFGACGSTGAALTQNSEMPLNNYNLLFSGHGTGTNLIGIGTSSCTLGAKLDVKNTTENITGRFFSTYASMTSILNANNDNSDVDPAFIAALGPTAIYGSSYNSNGGVGGLLRGRLIGVYGHALGNFEDLSTYGVWGVSDNSLDDNYGVRGDAIGNNSQENPFLQNFGVYGSATGESLSNNGVHGSATGDSEDGNVGVFGVASGSGTLNYGVYGSYSGTQDQYNCAGYFNGAVYNSTGTYGTSDITLKQNIQNFNDGLSIISQLHPKSFEFRVDEYPQINLPQGTNYGLIAQEVEEIIPSIVEDFLHPVVRDTLDSLIINPAVHIKAINYSGLVPFLISAIQQQQQQIDDLSSRLTSCCGPGFGEMQMPGNGNNQPSTIHYQELTSVVRDLPVLSQNQPNPFTEKTTLRFYLPKGTKEASLKVFDNTGNVHRLFSLAGEGPGTIEIEGNTLTAGNYYYSLLIGGNVIDTKTMVITK